jgi:hypothetical protein
VIIPPEDIQGHPGPLTAPLAPYSATLAHAASNLQAVFNGILRSPSPIANAYTIPTSPHEPRSGQPRPVSLPPTPDLPAELPGSILLENQGFPCIVDVQEEPALIHQTSGTSPTATYTPDDSLEEGVTADDLFPSLFEQLNHARSVPNLSERYTEPKSVRSRYSLNFATQPGHLKMQRKKHINDLYSRKSSRHSSMKSPTPADGKPSVCPTTTIAESGGESSNGRTTMGKEHSPTVAQKRTGMRHYEQPERCRSEVCAVCFLTRRGIRQMRRCA